MNSVPPPVACSLRIFHRIFSRLLAPGAPEHSALLYRMRSRRPSAQMPPLGTVVADPAAVELVRRWIERMEAPGPTALNGTDAGG